MTRSARWGFAVSAAAALLWVGLFTGSAQAAKPTIDAVGVVAQDNVVSVCVTASASTGIDVIHIGWGDGDNYNDTTDYPPGQVTSCDTHAYQAYGVYTVDISVYSGTDGAVASRTLTLSPSPPPPSTAPPPATSQPSQAAIKKCKKKYKGKAKAKKRKKCIKKAKAKAG